MNWILPEGLETAPTTYLLVVGAALLLTGADKGGFAAVGSLAFPMLLFVLPARFALGMWAPILVLLDVFTLRHYPKEWRIQPLITIAPWVLAGLVAGWFLLDRLDARLLKLIVGVLSVAFVVLDPIRALLVRREAKETPGDLQHGWRPGWLAASPFGLAAGISTMVAHAAGPVTTIYFLLQHMDKRVFVGTAARFYFVFNTVKIPFLVQNHVITADTLIKSLWLVPFAPLTVWLGAALNKRLPATAFRPVIYGLLAITGAYLIYKNG
ncbi:MAG TPA: sulfite exporter TauE/SafE family protein [Phycisphaerae bacterium]|nr:sulfite exporter TauE/SafE family protein [Phycisphaerae bacterium]HRY69101.1 sulfite exporter TauE/SafE family protein [Phycisphaerae bacterium]HSA29447.1 sulfite exporter TauE/SafE family protein [Phycisphaerae bacterium]